MAFLKKLQGLKIPQLEGLFIAQISKGNRQVERFLKHAKIETLDQFGISLVKNQQIQAELSNKDWGEVQNFNFENDYNTF